MAKPKRSYICSECGYESAMQYGKCPSCGEWNTMNEELVSTVTKTAEKKTTYNPYSAPLKLSGITTTDEFRYKTGIFAIFCTFTGSVCAMAWCCFAAFSGS